MILPSISFCPRLRLRLMEREALTQERVLDWLVHDLHYVPHEQRIPRGLTRKLCRGDMVNILRFLCAHLRDEREVATIRANLQLHGAKAVDDASRRQAMREERDRLKRAVTEVEEKTVIVEGELRHLLRELVAAEQKLRVVRANVAELQHRNNLLETYEWKIRRNVEVLNECLRRMEGVVSRDREAAQAAKAPHIVYYTCAATAGDEEGGETRALETASERTVRDAIGAVMGHMERRLHESNGTREDGELERFSQAMRAIVRSVVQPLALVPSVLARTLIMLGRRETESLHKQFREERHTTPSMPEVLRNKQTMHVDVLFCEAEKKRLEAYEARNAITQLYQSNVDQVCRLEAVLAAEEAGLAMFHARISTLAERQTSWKISATKIQGLRRELGNRIRAERDSIAIMRAIVNLTTRERSSFGRRLDEFHEYTQESIVPFKASPTLKACDIVSHELCTFDAMPRVSNTAGYALPPDSVHPFGEDGTEAVLATIERAQNRARVTRSLVSLEEHLRTQTLSRIRSLRVDPSTILRIVHLLQEEDKRLREDVIERWEQRRQSAASSYAAITDLKKIITDWWTQPAQYLVPWVHVKERNLEAWRTRIGDLLANLETQR